MPCHALFLVFLSDNLVSVSLPDNHLKKTEQAIEHTEITVNESALAMKPSQENFNISDLSLKLSTEQPSGKANQLKPFNVQGENIGRSKPSRRKPKIDTSRRLARKESMLGMRFDHGDNCTKVLPQALIIGVMKCGTETIMTFLAIHPDIAMQLKLEAVQFFDKNHEKGLEWYRNQMPCSSEGQITIEKSPQYITTPFAPKRVHKMDRDIKLILSIREPIDRAISHYEHVAYFSPGKFPDTFEKTAISPLGGINGGHEALQRSLYSVHLKQWLNYFNLDQIHIVDADNFKLNPTEELNKIEKFLGIRQYFTQNSFYYNKDKGFYCLNLLGGSAGCMNKGKGREHRKVSRDVIDKLKEFYKPYNEDFFDIIGRRFDWGY